MNSETFAVLNEPGVGFFSMVIIGNSQTYVKDGWMITPRGYENKEGGL